MKPGRKGAKKIRLDRSWNVYENKGNSGKMTGEMSDSCAWLSGLEVTYVPDRAKNA
jgi:hypothetical protein